MDSIAPCMLTHTCLAILPCAHLLAQGYRRDPFYDDEQESKKPVRQYPPRGSRKKSQSGSGQLFKNQRQIGAGLIGIGVLLTFLGMMLFFEGNLLRLGNMSLIIGIPLLVGPERIKGYFLQSSRMQATIILVLGIFLVFTGRPRIGIIFEIFGLLNLFGNMFPLLLAMGKNVPIVGDILRSFEGEGGGKGRQRRYGTEF